ncbi:heavy-metal-associated domain-containing protein [Ruminiclostridium sufflavum DSM 19573]|uniref:Heavy-metal-associated domain-containing protein n=1 Tax=Ruminiclostridium sufflavum DSM 19573 TaxID=1121337 RepID=A0A318XQU1_9FIRM|nr:heavy-metal-associated domain-containing protein [Ruminiclostridium sufflavum]PYG89565.1 heavy-metal-associated domain-containing protein [Ruminiclostridium sufflavum DSM 19573]
MKKVFKLKNLGCANCASKMEREINKLNGVKNATINFITQKLTFDSEEQNLDETTEAIKKIVKKIEPNCSLQVT